MLIDGPATPDFVYVLAHGAGAGMRHAFLADGEPLDETNLVD